MSQILDRVRDLRVDRLIGLRPPYPPVVVELDADEVVLARIKRRGRGRPLLESYLVRRVPEISVPTSIFEPLPAPAPGMPDKLRQLFEASGTRPGRVSVILPDNLAKITLLTLPERPASRRQLDELVRSKMRRAVPFRVEDASLSYLVLPGEGRRVSLLVVVVRKALVQRIESAFAAFGARAGLIDICTPNLINLYRDRLAEACRENSDVALLNCAQNYFSLVILRNEKLIFFRCKTFGVAENQEDQPNGILAREVANSFSYYREKLDGSGVGTIFVRSSVTAPEVVAQKLSGLGCETVSVLDPSGDVELSEGLSLDSATAQRIAPALGAATGRGR